ncbi:MAG: amidohydrolase family protein [Anaerolineae bacterium]
MKAIDLHVHPFTPEILEKTPEWFWRHPREVFSIHRQTISIDTLLEDMDRADVERAVLLAFDCETTYGFKVSNEDVAEIVRQHPDRFLGFASVDPHKGELGVRELEHSVRELGLRGLKLHPPTQQFYASDKAYYPLWAKTEELQIPLLIHTGHTFAGGYLKYAEPVYIDDVAADFPNLKIVLSHFGFPWVEQVISLAWTRPNVYIELAGWSPIYIPEIIWRFARTLMADRFVFGTDYPGLTAERWIRDFAEVSLDQEVREKILYRNAHAILFGDGGD